MTQQQTERERLAEKIFFAEKLTVTERDRIASLLRGDEPAKPDRYVEIWQEAEKASLYARELNHNSDQAAAAVLRRHFEPPSEVVEAAKSWQHQTSSPGIMARFILKSDQ